MSDLARRLSQSHDASGKAVQMLQTRTRLALEQVDEALQAANAREERVYLPQLYLIEGGIARARGESAAARASVRRAVAEARAEEAPWLELMALLELCGHDGATAKERQSMAALVDQLPEAADTTAITRARALLGKTKAA